MALGGGWFCFAVSSYSHFLTCERLRSNLVCSHSKKKPQNTLYCIKKKQQKTQNPAPKNVPFVLWRTLPAANPASFVTPLPISPHPLVKTPVGTSTGCSFGMLRLLCAPCSTPGTAGRWHRAAGPWGCHGVGVMEPSEQSGGGFSPLSQHIFRGARSGCSGLLSVSFSLSLRRGSKNGPEKNPDQPNTGSTEPTGGEREGMRSHEDGKGPAGAPEHGGVWVLGENGARWGCGGGFGAAPCPLPHR